MSAAATSILIDVRDATPHDLDGLEWLDGVCFERPWCRGEWAALLDDPAAMVVVAEIRGSLVGAAVFQPARFADGGWMTELLFVAVSPDFRRMLVGTRLMLAVRERAAGVPIVTLVGERNLDAQLWLKALGFRWTVTVRAPFSEDGPERQDGYLFRCDPKTPPAAQVRRVPR
jgi:ribosomal protein S18 acetylase RimI-like enzyme